MTYEARIGGARDNDSSDLVAQLEQWAEDGRQLDFIPQKVPPPVGPPESADGVVAAVIGAVAGLLSIVAAIGGFLAVWRWRMAPRESKTAQE